MLVSADGGPNKEPPKVDEFPEKENVEQKEKSIEKLSSVSKDNENKTNQDANADGNNITSQTANSTDGTKEEKACRVSAQSSNCVD